MAIDNTIHAQIASANISYNINVQDIAIDAKGRPRAIDSKEKSTKSDKSSSVKSEDFWDDVESSLMESLENLPEKSSFAVLSQFIPFIEHEANERGIEKVKEEIRQIYDEQEPYVLEDKQISFDSAMILLSVEDPEFMKLVKGRSKEEQRKLFMLQVIDLTIQGNVLNDNKLLGNALVIMEKIINLS